MQKTIRHWGDEIDWLAACFLLGAYSADWAAEQVVTTTHVIELSKYRPERAHYVSTAATGEPDHVQSHT